MRKLLCALTLICLLGVGCSDPFHIVDIKNMGKITRVDTIPGSWGNPPRLQITAEQRVVILIGTRISSVPIGQDLFIGKRESDRTIWVSFGNKSVTWWKLRN